MQSCLFIYDDHASFLSRDKNGAWERVYLKSPGEIKKLPHSPMHAVFCNREVNIKTQIAPKLKNLDKRSFYQNQLELLKETNPIVTVLHGDDIYTIINIANDSAWLKALDEAEVFLEGIFALPAVVTSLFEKSEMPMGWCIVNTPLSEKVINQSVFYNKQLSFSRVSNAKTLEKDIEATKAYINRQPQQLSLPIEIINKGDEQAIAGCHILPGKMLSHDQEKRWLAYAWPKKIKEFSTRSLIIPAVLCAVLYNPISNLHSKKADLEKQLANFAQTTESTYIKDYRRIAANSIDPLPILQRVSEKLEDHQRLNILEWNHRSQEKLKLAFVDDIGIIAADIATALAAEFPNCDVAVNDNAGVMLAISGDLK